MKIIIKWHETTKHTNKQIENSMQFSIFHIIEFSMFIIIIQTNGWI